MGIEEFAFVNKYGQPSITNIFFLDFDPELAAQAHCDRHVYQMPLDCAQLLSSAWHELHGYGADHEIPNLIRRHVYPVVTGEAAAERYRQLVPIGEAYTAEWRMFGQRIYSSVFADHSCAKWVRELGGNYLWLWQMGMALAAEYEHRFGKPHFARGVLYTLERIPPALKKSVSDWTEAPPIMPEVFKVRDESGQFYDSVQSYRNCYIDFKQNMLAYTKRKLPNWMERRNEKYILAHT